MCNQDMLLPITLVICIPLGPINFYIGAHCCLTVYAVRVEYCMFEKGANAKYLVLKGLQHFKSQPNWQGIQFISLWPLNVLDSNFHYIMGAS